MKRLYRLISLLLALIIAGGMFFHFSATASAANATVRDTVLILDESGSMDGDPMDALKKSAEEFCESVLNDSGTNRVAIITYSSYARLVCDFTSDLAMLRSAIYDMDEYGRTNIFDALGIADDLLTPSPANVKNIVLMSDGLPNEGQITEIGRYDYLDYGGYDYANAVFDRATSYHDRYYVYTLGFFHNLSNDTLAFASRFMEDLQNAGYYEVNRVEDLEFTFGEIAEEIIEAKLTGSFKYVNGSSDYSSTYYYADEYFYDTSLQNYNQSLATMSLCLAMSAFGSSEVSSYRDKSINVKNLMTELLFEDFATTETFTQKPTADSIAAAIGHKKIKDHEGNVYTLIAVAVRGGGYEQEWASNFTIGATGNHAGFDKAANEVLTFIRSYITDTGIEGDIKLWITGYSRAAATANLTAAYLDAGASLGSTVVLDKKNLYAYCFETPAGTTEADANDKGKYGNIYNIVNPNDLVTKVAPTKMGFRRYGIDKVLPSAENKYNTISPLRDEMKKQYEQLESVDEYVLDGFVYKKVDLTGIRSNGKGLTYDSEEQMLMGVFLDNLLAKLVDGYINRALYNAKIEDGVRELCKAVFQDESKFGKVMDDTVGKIKSNLGGLCWKFLWDELGAYEEIAGYLSSSLKENGAKNFDEKEIKKAAKPLLDCVIACLANNIDYFVTIVDNKDCFRPAHYPELCLAWMRSMDENYTTDAGEAFSSGSYRIVRINCPVDVEAYDSKGVLVAAFANDEVQEIENSSIYALLNGDGEKLIYLPADEEFKIEIKGRENGNVTYSVNEYSYEAGQVNRIVNYYDVPIEKERTLRAVIPAYDEMYLTEGTEYGTDTNYSLTDMNGNAIAPDLDIAGDVATSAFYTVTAASENNEYGTVIGSGIRQVGSFAQVVAVAKEGYTFEGWYVNGEIVSTDSEYRFCVTADITLIAKFTDGSQKQIPTEDGKASNDGMNGVSQWLIIILALLIIVIVLIVVSIILFYGKRNAQDAADKTDAAQSRTSNADNAADEKITEDAEKRNGLLQITNGSMSGFSVPIKDGETLFLGKDPKYSQVVFSKDYINVSRLHCSIMYDAKANRYYVTDMSSNGTYLIGKKRLINGRRTPVGINTVIILANEDCTVLLG